MLSTITARLTKKNDEYIKSITGGQGVIDAQTGELRSTFDILQDLSKAWENLTSVEKQELTETVAGKTQRALFTALMTNFSTAVGATEAALNSEGSALEENNKRMNSLHGRLTKLNTAWQDFSRNTINSEGVKSILALGTALVKFADSDMGRFLTAEALVVAGITLLSKGFGALKSVILTNGQALYQYLLILNGVPAAEAMASASTLGLAGSIKILTTALLTNPLFIGVAVATGIYAIVKAVDALNVSFEEQVEKAEEAANKYKEAKNNLEENTKTLEEKKKKLEEISKLEGQDNSLKYKNEKAQLEAEVSTLEDKQKVLEKIAEEEKKTAQREAEKTLTAKTSTQTYKKVNAAKGTTLDVKQEDVTILEKLNVEMENYNQLLAAHKENEKGVIESEGSFVKRQEDLITKMSDTRTSMNSTVKQLLELKGNLDVSTESGKNYAQQIDEAIKKAQDFVDGIDAETNSVENQSDAVSKNNEEIEKANKLADQYKSALDGNIDSMINYGSNMDLLKTAQDELANSGAITAETFKSLTENNLLGYLDEVNGKLTVNTDAFTNSTSSIKENALANLQASTYEQIRAIVLEDLKNKEIDTGNEAQNAANKLEQTGNSAANMGKQLIAAAGDAAQLNTQLAAIAGKSYTPSSDASAKIDEVLKKAQKTQAFINKWKPSSSKSATKKASSGKGKGKGKKKSSKETYKAEVDTLYKYENALDNAKDAVDRLNDALKNTDNFNEREKYLKKLISATKDEIEATNDLRKAQTRQINDYIKQLRKQGFQISYNSKTNELNINNMERLGKFSGDTAKNLEKMIKKIQDLNKDNRSLSGSVRDLNADIEDFNKQLEELPTEKLEKFNELMEKFQQSRLDQIQNQIDDIQHEMENDPRLKALEAQIEALEKQNDELDSQKELEEKILAVEQAKDKLANQRKNKTIQVYREGQGFVWEADINAIQDAADELKDAQDELNDKIKQDEIDRLNAEKEALENSYQNRIDALQNFLDDQNYLIDKANREGIQTFAELQKQMAKFGLDNAENLKKATDWLNNYNKSLSDLNQTVSGILSSSTKATDGLIYSSKTQDRINSALSSIMPNLDTSTGLTLSNVRTEATDKEKSNSIYINSIELPNVKDIDDFIKALQDLPRMASSQSTLRK